MKRSEGGGVEHVPHDAEDDEDRLCERDAEEGDLAVLVVDVEAPEQDAGGDDVADDGAGDAGNLGDPALDDDRHDDDGVEDHHTLLVLRHLRAIIADLRRL